jgi:hypothetical protein
VISSLELHDGNGAAVLRISTAANADAELELWATSRHLRPFEKLVRKTIKLEVSEERRSVKRLAGPLDAARDKPLK